MGAVFNVEDRAITRVTRAYVQLTAALTSDLLG
jgi:hypothetical protein